MSSIGPVGRELWRFRRVVVRVVLLLVSWSVGALVIAGPAQAQTSAETAAVNWATAQIGSTAWPGLCLPFVYAAYKDGAGVNLEGLTSGVAYNANTDPQDVWGHTSAGTTGTGTPPYGALVFFDAKSGYNPEDYSHVTIMGANGEMISSPDVVNESAVHYETLAQHASSGAYDTYVGWWLPDGSTTPPTTTPPSFTQANLLEDGGFEAGGVGWQMLSPGSGVGSDANYASSSTNSAYGGPAYQEANWSTLGGSLYQDVPVSMAQNQSATFSIWLKMGVGESSGEVANVCLWALVGSNTSACQDKALTAQWQQVQVTLTMPAATSELRAQVYIPPGVNIDFDDGVLTNNLLEDGGFGASGVGWSTLPASGGSMNFATYSNSGAHDGRSYAEANSSLDGGSIYQDVAVNMAQNQSATLSMWVRLAPGTAVAGQSADLCVWALVGSNTSACESKALTEEWQQLQATVTMPAATSKLRAQVYIPANINVDFDGATLGAPQTADAAYVPAVLTNPEVVGTVAVGSSVACSGAQWSNEPESYAYAWMRDGKPIASATAAAYSVTSADAGQSLSCAITARNAAGSAIGTSGAVSVSPQIAGTPGPSGSGTDLSGTSPGQEQATAPGCVVPRLRNMTLAQAKTALTRSHCRLGSVRRPVHVARRHVLRVWAQSVRRGSRHPSGYAVNLTLRAVKT